LLRIRERSQAHKARHQSLPATETASVLNDRAPPGYRRPWIPIGVIPAVGFLALFFALPFLILVYYSLLTVEQGRVVGGPSLQGYARFLTDPFTYFLFGRTLLLSGAVTVVCLLLGYPVAYLYTRLRSTVTRTILLGTIITPLLTSSLVLAFGWIVILGRQGVLNELLVALDVIDERISILFTIEAVFIGMVQVHLPFMIVPLIATLRGIPPELEQAAADLGASGWQTFWKVTIPQSVPGITAGMSLVFVLAYTAFTVPTLMGGASLQLVSVYIWNNVRLLSWSSAAVIASLLLLTSLAVIVALTAVSRYLTRWQRLSP
jgi:ABC-type spermidine/putrescine transport system permease subunit I